MTRWPALVALIAVVACPATAQTALRPGQTVQGELTASDPTLGDGSYFDCFTIQTRPGQTLQIDQVSDEFDSYLAAGSGSCASMTNAISDDDGGGGLNSRLAFEGDGSRLFIRVNSLSANVTGPYTLRISETVQQTAEQLSAEATGGPLRETGGVEGEVIFMVSGEIPRARPTAPVEVWEWQFWPDQTGAFRVRVNCQTGTSQNLIVERYLNGRLDGRRELTVPPVTPPAGSTGAATVQMVCEPGPADQQRSHADFRTARAQMDRYFAATN
jgi:hypothetical protein